MSARAKIKSALSISLCLIFLGCGISIGNPPKKDGTQTAEVSVASPVSLNFAAPDTRVHDIKNESGQKVGTITLTQNVHAFRNIRFYQKGQASETILPGPYLVDLINGTIEPRGDAEQIMSGSYDEIRGTPAIVEPGKFASIGIFNPILGFTSHVAGLVTINGVSFPFDFPFLLGFDIQAYLAAANTDSKVLANRQNTVTVELNFANYFVVKQPEDMLNAFKVQEFWQDQAFKAGTFTIKQP